MLALAGTFTRAVDDFWHSFILIAGLMIGFATIATWRFGDELEAFATLDKSLQTEFFLMCCSLNRNPKPERDAELARALAPAAALPASPAFAFTAQPAIPGCRPRAHELCERAPASASAQGTSAQGRAHRAERTA
jgi:hypothetical protein